MVDIVFENCEILCLPDETVQQGENWIRFFSTANNPKYFLTDRSRNCYTPFERLLLYNDIICVNDRYVPWKEGCDEVNGYQYTTMNGEGSVYVEWRVI